MEIWRGRVLWRVYVHPHTHPHTQLKKSGIPHTHTHTQSMWVRTIPTGMGLFTISINEIFSCNDKCIQIYKIY